MRYTDLAGVAGAVDFARLDQSRHGQIDFCSERALSASSWDRILDISTFKRLTFDLSASPCRRDIHMW